MEENQKRNVIMGIGLLLGFVLWTILIQNVDVQPAGPEGTKIGFAAFNVWFHKKTGVHMMIYTVTDWLGLVPVCVCLCFGAVGVIQSIKRRSLAKVDLDIILLGVYYVLIIIWYLVFEVVPINYRPILINGVLEASYPSSTTLLVLSVMPTLKYQIDRRSESRLIRIMTSIFVILFSMFMVIGRLIAGVHWATDIVGSVLLSTGVFMLYRFVTAFADKKSEKRLSEVSRNGIQ